MEELSNHDEQQETSSTSSAAALLNDDDVGDCEEVLLLVESPSIISAGDVSPQRISSNNDNQTATQKIGNLRWFGLTSICLLMTAEYYSIDIPAALHQDMKDYLSGGPNDNDDDAESTSTFELRFNLLYTVYSMPNVVLPLLGGFVVDRFGPTRCMIGYSLCVWLGQVLFAAGLAQKSWTIMLLGRAVFGIGGESICVANSTLLTDWFDPSERALAFGILLAISRLGSVLNNVVSPLVAHTFATPWALWLGVLLNTGGVVAACLVQYLDSSWMRTSATTAAVEDRSSDLLTEPLLTPQQRRHDSAEPDEFLEMELSTDSTLEGTEQQTTDVHPDALGRNNTPQPITSTAPELSTIGVGILDIARLGPIFWLLCICCMVVYGCIMPFNNVASGILLERNLFRTPPTDCVLEFPQQCTTGTNLLANVSNPALDSNGVSCPGQGFAPVLPLLPLHNVSSENYNPNADTKVACDKSFWADECTQDYCDALHAATETAGRTMSIPYAVSAILSPPIGSLVDRVGRRAALACGTSMVLMVVHLILAFTPSDAVPLWFPLLGQGIAYSLFSAVIWPSVGMVVEPRMCGTAYGIILSMQNLGLALFPMLVAFIYKHSDQQYIPNVELLFVGCAAVGSIAGMLLFVLDRRNGSKLHSVGAEDL